MPSTTSQSQGLLLFKVSALQSFALGTLKIQEVVPYQGVTKLPNAGHNVIGATSIRGKTLAIIDMAAAMGYPAITPAERGDCVIIITDCSQRNVGFLVRNIERIIDCHWKDIDPPPTSLGDKSYITGISRFDNKLTQLIDIELLLAQIFPDNGDPSIEISAAQKAQLQKEKILLVDDSFVARKQLENALTCIDVPYQVCKNGHDALQVMKQNAQQGQPITILVSDIEMPGLDGYELTFEVRNLQQIASAYIILHTSLSSAISVDRAMQVGADQALTKFAAQALIDAMLKPN